jgi:hypothetical protein
LIKIPKDQAAVWEVLKHYQIDVRQELETSFVALANRGELRILRGNRISFTLLGRDVGGKEIFLIPAAVGPEILDPLRSVGRIAVVEPTTALFWSERGNPLDLLPHDLPRKVLSERSILPHLRPTVGLEADRVFQVEQDPLIESIADQVSSDNLRTLVQGLQDFETRFASTVNCEASGQSIFNYFQALGLDVRFQPFPFGGGFTSRNVIAEKTGETYPDDILIICCHYDSISPAATRMTLAPGADDNASGTAGIMEAARILVDIPCDFTIRFIAFSAEEWGLYGSRAYAAGAKQEHERIIGVINLDMIAYADAVPEDLEIIVDGQSEWLGVRLGLAAAHYASLASRRIVNASFTYSDHSPFWDQGYSALLAIEDSPLANPYYHQTTDTVDTLNLDFFEDSTRAALALLAELAQPLRIGYPQTPVGVETVSQIYTSLFHSIRNVRLSWAGQTDAVGYNVYRTTSSHLEYQKVNGVPVGSTTFTDNDLPMNMTFYYVVTAVDAAGLESNRSVEVEAVPSRAYHFTNQTEQALSFRIGGRR